MFKTKGYKLIDLNFGFEDLIVKSFEEFVRLYQVLPRGDNSVSPNPVDVSMESLAAIVHRDYTTPIVEKETNLKLIPTYCYTRKYFQGSILHSHTDRPACEISLSYCISGHDWEMDMGNNIIITKKGNGVIYKGCKVLHGRSKPSPGEVIQVFNHWIISDSKRSKSAYDDGKQKEFYKS